jgi:LmbE family N-acetylglucosaminyl deacetylase
MSDRRLLAVLAHPDDESFGPGGTLARYAADGVDVHIAICTDGSAGSVTEEFESSRSRLAEIRQQELQSAVAILGAQLHQLGYRDSGYIGDPANEDPQAFMNIETSQAAARVVRLIREVRPQVVVTHDETGGYFHPDHIKAHEITLEAFHAAGDATKYPGVGKEPYAPQRLYYTAFPTRWLKIFRFVARLQGQDISRMGRNNDVDFTSLGRPMEELHARINTFDSWDTKMAASAQHRSQGGGTGGFVSWMPGWLQKRLMSTEYFIRAYPPARNGERVTDLFAGVRVRSKQAM